MGGQLLVSLLAGPSPLQSSPALALSTANHLTEEASSQMGAIFPKRKLLNKIFWALKCLPCGFLCAFRGESALVPGSAGPLCPDLPGGRGLCAGGGALRRRAVLRPPGAAVGDRRAAVARLQVGRPLSPTGRPLRGPGRGDPGAGLRSLLGPPWPGRPRLPQRPGQRGRTSGIRWRCAAERRALVSQGWRSAPATWPSVGLRVGWCGYSALSWARQGWGQSSQHLRRKRVVTCTWTSFRKAS
jgi:hypothetical protein